MQRAWDAMPDWFEVLPQAPCGVQSTLTGAKAFYFPPAGDGSRGGTFFVNVADPSSWGTFELESMAFHEGIPGHHLQLAIASELEDVPEFRKHIHNAAYAEGWGLYTERLSDEMGLYTARRRPDGDVRRRLDARLPAGRRHRPARARLEPAAGGRLHGGELAAGGGDGAARRSTATSSRRARRRPTWSAGWRSSGCGPRPSSARGAGFEVKKFHSAVLDSGSLPLGVLDDVVRARLP